jgi:hypothetical protein
MACAGKPFRGAEFDLTTACGGTVGTGRLPRPAERGRAILDRMTAGSATSRAQTGFPAAR